MTVIPYLHKSIKREDVTGAIEPFVAVPMGVALSQGTYHTITSLVFGSLFQHTEHFQSVLEFGISMNQANTYLSGGIVYYH